jgi:signal transduction histidine kinase/DNA-binding response OmpR family regulator
MKTSPSAPVRIGNGIVLRTILVTLLAFLVSSLVAIAYTTHETGQRAEQTIDARLVQLLDTVESTVKVACFVNDPGLAREVALGLLGNPEVLRVSILAGQAVLADEIRRGASVGMAEMTPGIIERHIVSPFDASETVGTVRLIPNPEVIENLKDSAILLAAKQIVWQLVFVSAAILAALILLLVRPISRMSLALQKMDPTAGDRLFIPAGHERTEIGQLARSVNQLADHLVTALEETRQARQAAEHAASAKSSFLANMSHEIRTPLNAVLGLARIGMKENMGRKAGDTCQRILVFGEHLLGVINDILDFSKIEAGKMSIESAPLQLSQLVAEAIDLVAGRAVEKQLVLTSRLSPDLPAWVAGDAMRIRQILVNLLSNAIKFTARGHVDLSVIPADGEVWFAIRDEGIGMTPEELSRLFRPFEQADSSTTRRFGGTGLGLAISMNLASLMGGVIHASSVFGQGSIFTLQLPLAATSAPAAGATATIALPAGAHRLDGLRILAAEDVDVNRFILADILNEAGAHADFAENGRIAVERVSAAPSAWDVILMDVQMPEMDGHEATRRIKPIAPRLPVIGLTAHALPEEREKCLAAGMVDHVSKPVSPEVLVAAILRHVRVPAPATEPTQSAHSPPSAQPATFPAQTVPDAVPPAPTFSPRTVDSAIDWQKLEIRFKGKRAFVQKIFQSILANHTNAPARLRELSGAADYDALAFLAHGLKGIAGNIAATPQQDLAARTESLARQRDPHSLTLARELAESLEALLAELNDYLAEAASSDDGRPDDTLRVTDATDAAGAPAASHAGSRRPT